MASVSLVLSIIYGPEMTPAIREDKNDYEYLALNLLKQSACPVININYRLSPQKADVPPVHHPAHALDVLEALKFIQEHGSKQLGIPQPTLGNLYLLGHSCGAHIITSIVLDAQSESHEIDTPSSLLSDIKGILLSDGIYEIDLLLKKFPSYSGFIQGAFGEHDSYKTFSPAYYKLRGESPIYWLVVHSKGDTLVDEEQAESLWDHLWELYDRKAHQYVEADWERLKVDHDEVLRVPEYVAMVSQFVNGTLAKRASASEPHM